MRDRLNGDCIACVRPQDFEVIRAQAVPQVWKTNLLSGLTVARAMVPEAIAFALVAHVSPLTGLYAAFIVALITSAFGGRSGMISGATGALAVVIVALVAQHGAEYLFATVVLMGVLQLIFAAAKLGRLAVSSTPNGVRRRLPVY